MLAPQKGKQQLAATTNVDVMIYGGSAGCVDRYTQFLTKDGWKYMHEYTDGDDVYVYNDLEGSFYFEKPEDYIKLPCEDLFRMQGNGIDMVVSEEHCLLYWDADGELCETFLLDSAEDIVKNPSKYTFKNEHGDNLQVSDISWFKPVDGMKYCFNVPTGYFLARRSGTTFITGNSGKSRLLLLKAGYYAHNDPLFEGVMFRRTTKPLTAAGGLFSEAKKLYRPLGVDVREQALEILFHGNGGSSRNRKGGNLKFTHLEHEKDAEGNHQGLQYSFIGFDELTHFTQTQFLYLIGRMRSAAEGDSFCLATTNPDYNSWVYNWVSWYLKDGIFDESKLGVIRYFVIVDDTPVFSCDEKELADSYPDLCYIYNPIEDKTEYVPPMSFIFIGGTIFDNPALIRANPKYLSALKAQTEINRRRLLDGDWHAVPEGSQLIERRFFNKLDKLPNESYIEARAWDFASEEPSDKNRYPDYTTSVKMRKYKDGTIVIMGDYEEDSFDEKTQVYGRYRLRSGARDKAILRQAQSDGNQCVMVLAVDPASSGKFQYQEQSKFFMSEGFLVKPDPMPNNKSKLIKFEPFATAVQNGLIYIYEKSFNNKQTLETFYKDLEKFDGSRSSSSYKDDLPDSAASCYNFIITGKVRRPMSAGTSTSTTLSSYRKSLT